MKTILLLSKTLLVVLAAGEFAPAAADEVKPEIIRIGILNTPENRRTAPDGWSARDISS